MIPTPLLAYALSLVLATPSAVFAAPPTIPKPLPNSAVSPTTDIAANLNNANVNANSLTTITVAGENATLSNGLLTKISQSGLAASSISLIVQPLGKKPHLVGTPPTVSPVTKPVISYLPHTARTPASTQKLIPTLIALDTLGADFSWVTQAYQQGLVIGDTLYGNLRIQGSGDPKFNHERLRALLASLPQKGIRHIQGDIVIDNGIFERVNFNPNTFDGQGLKAYNAPPNGFLVNFGTLQVDIIPSGRLPAVTPFPSLNANVNANLNAVPTSSANLTVIPSVAPIKSGSEAENTESSAPSFIADPNATTAAVRLLPPLADFAYPAALPITAQACGTTPAAKPRLSNTSLTYTGLVSANCGVQSSWLTFPDSDTFIKKAVKGTWQQLDPTFRGEVRLISEPSTSPPAKFAQWSLPLPIVSLPSFPLANQIWDINHYSNNVMTEQVTLSLPVYAGGQKSSNYPAAFNFINHWWQAHLPNTTPPVMTRGSGLCRDCLVEPASMLALLNYGFQQADFATFHDSMGIAGVSGTMKALKKRHPDSPAIGNAWIKTGTLDNVTSMVGYVKSQSGDWYAVVGMVNAPNVGHNDHVKAVLDEMLAWTAVQ